MTGHRRPVTGLWDQASLYINVCLCFEGALQMVSSVFGVFQKVSSVFGVFHHENEKTNPPGGSESPEAQLYLVQENFAR